MTKLLHQILGELGIPQYFDVFLEQGFDTWDTILDITESDLDALGVKLGHRRKLQRRIAHFRGIAPQTSLVSPTLACAEDVKQEPAIKAESPKAETRDAPPVVTKRKYRRHPKPDENAPERPPSAYVLFSNKMREELKGQNLSFTEMAKLVGEHWQNLTAAEKEPYESRAQAIKERYLAEYAEYKKTEHYRKYQAYLQEFRAKYPSPSHDKDTSKRVKLEPQSQRRASPGATPTRTSRSGSGSESLRGSEPPCSRPRVGSIVSASDPQHPSAGPAAPASASDDSATTPAAKETERPSRDISPTVGKGPKSLPPLTSAAPPGGQGEAQHARERFSMHRQLPSLSDVFEGQPLPSGRDGPPSLTGPGDRPYSGAASTHPPSFGQSRTPVDGSLPIHALLASKPDPSFPATDGSSHAHQAHQSSYHADPRPAGPSHYPMQDGPSNRHTINGYHQHHHSVPAAAPSVPARHSMDLHHSYHQHRHHHHQHQHHHSEHGFRLPPSQPPPPQQHPTLSPPPPPPPPLQPPSSGGAFHSQKPPAAQSASNNNVHMMSSGLDGMSALLKAGELVDGRTQ
ncbi:hypothetical protein VTJ83DRAFT_544 [Remersonia thermophila]|uniref:HMG box domain-containing protein n=1 Tax=Remersonia thermophila TaxID=72144 RepID=A0ABR4DLD5_9PEZI